jgi:ATP-dependent Clp endopeptidase proteolytic subunit ClpP
MDISDLRALAEAPAPTPPQDSAPGEIFIYGVIGGWDHDSVFSSSFLQQLRQLEQQYDRINVRINSPGGSLYDGLAIYNALASSTKEVHTYIDGIAFSMAGIIAMAGKTVHAAKASMLMFHNASGIAIGNAEDFRTTAEELDKWDRIIAEGVATKTGKPVEEVISLFFDYKDHFFTADEALSEGLVDVLDAHAATEIPAGIENMSFSNRLAYYTRREQKTTGGFISAIKNLFAGSGSPPAAQQGQTPTPGKKIFSQADLSTRIQAMAEEHQKVLFEVEAEALAAKQQATRWQALAEEYGSQPGAFPTAPAKRNGDRFDEAGPDQEAPQLYWEAQDVARFQRKS